MNSSSPDQIVSTHTPLQILTRGVQAPRAPVPSSADPRLRQNIAAGQNMILAQQQKQAAARLEQERMRAQNVAAAQRMAGVYVPSSGPDNMTGY